MRGTLLHEWQNYWILTRLLGHPAERLMPPTQPIEREEADKIFEILDYISKIMDEYPDVQILTERYAPFPQNIVPAEDCGGTADVVLYSQSSKRAWVLDSKFGRIFVEVFDNSQGSGYAVSTLWHVPVERVTVIIAQPYSPAANGEWIREWTFSSDYLVEFQARVERALIAAEAPNPQPTAGSWCTYCAAELTCPARQAQINSVVGENFAAVAPLGPFSDPSPEYEPIMRQMPDDQLAHVVLLEKSVKAYLKAAVQEASLRARQGRPPPGLKLFEAQAKSTWKEVPKKDGDAARGLAVRLAAIIGNAVFTEAEWEQAENSGYFDEQVKRFVITTTPGLGETKDYIKGEVRRLLDIYRPGLSNSEKNKLIREAGHGVDMLTHKPRTGEPVLGPASSNREEWNPARKVLEGLKPIKLG
jgi:hypothetical protein